jgi:hypothetical protein
MQLRFATGLFEIAGIFLIGDCRLRLLSLALPK